MIKMLTAAALIALAPAASAGAPTLEGGIGDRLAFPGDRVLTPVAVVEDSRCPAEALCIQAGRLVVAVALEDGPDARQRNLELGVPARVEGGMLTLVAGDPRPTLTRATAMPKDYGFRFSFAEDVVRYPAIDAP